MKNENRLTSPPMVENNSKSSDNMKPNRGFEHISDIFWTIVALISIWIGISSLTSPIQITLFGLVWGLLLVGLGMSLMYLVWI